MDEENGFDATQDFDDYADASDYDEEPVRDIEDDADDADEGDIDGTADQEPREDQYLDSYWEDQFDIGE